jgi:hypothetical protein
VKAPDPQKKNEKGMTSKGDLYIVTSLLELDCYSSSRAVLLLVGEEQLPEDPHGVVRVGDGVTDRSGIAEDLVIVSSLVSLQEGDINS